MGEDWQNIIAECVSTMGRLVVRDASHHTCREDNPLSRFGLITVDGGELARRVPGLWELYKGPFADMMRLSVANPDELSVYNSPDHGLELVSQELEEAGIDGYKPRMEAHVDQRFTAVLVVSAPSISTEGRLVISDDPRAKTAEEIGKTATYIPHQSGTVFCFTAGRELPHYTESITLAGSARIVCALNYPHVDESPEAAQELLQHIQKGAN